MAQRGRPPLSSTIERDAQILDILTREHVKRRELAIRLGVSVNIVYASLARLRRAGLVDCVRDGKLHLWVRTSRG